MTVETVVRTEDAPAADRLGLWHDMSRDHMVPVRMRAERGHDYYGTMTAWDLGSARLLDMTGDPAHLTRTPRQIRQSDPGLYKVEVHLRGGSILAQDGRQARLGTGQVAVVDTGRPYELAAGYPGGAAHSGTRLRLLALTLPRGTLPADRVARVTGTDLARSMPTGALVAATLVQMGDRAAAGDTLTAGRLVPILTDLVAVGLAGLDDTVATLDGERRRRAALARVQASIRANLADPELSPGMIARAAHMSLRALHQLFADHAATTVSAYIRDTRLERCRRDLADPGQRLRPVAAIAASWGFTSAAHFTRVFRTAYDLPPAAYRDLHTPAA